jgi:hypothetical protein
MRMAMMIRIESAILPSWIVKLAGDTMSSQSNHAMRTPVEVSARSPSVLAGFLERFIPILLRCLSAWNV